MRIVTFRVRGRDRIGAYHDGVGVDLRAAYAALLGESIS